MSRDTSVRGVARSLLLVLGLTLLPAAAFAQSGVLSGTVTDERQAPVAGAQLSVLGTRITALTNASGAFTLANVPAGSYQLRVLSIGYAPLVLPVSVQAGQTTRVDAQLVVQPIELGGVVVSASRRPERATEAPAAITRIGSQTLEKSVGNTFAASLKAVPGLDFVQVGMTTVGVNARGFNSSFNNRMLMLEDGRVAVLPENGLPVGQFTATPKVDLAGLEVLTGPGAALYGADASSGVLSLESKDPMRFQGTTVELSGGSRSYMDVQARHAGVAGKVGYKVAGEWQQAKDWDSYLDYATAAGAKNEAGILDFNAKAVRGSGALVYYGDLGRFEVNGGLSRSDGVGQTNVGRNQLKGWGYNVLQGKFSNDHWYLSAYRTQSTSGDSYAVNRYIPARFDPANASRSDEAIRNISGWPSDGRLYAAELQNNFQVEPLLGTRITWGAQYRRDVVSSDRQWLTDALTGKDLAIKQYGVYAQTETPVAPWMDVVLAARYDNHDKYDAQFSPKAGVVLKPAADQAVRVTYNRAFKSPTTLQTSFFIYDFTKVGALGIGVFGNAEGFTIKDAGGNVKEQVTPVVPEENTTWEVGYKGVLGGRLWVDATGYSSDYKNFLSPLVFLGNPLLGESTYFANGELVKAKSTDVLPQWVMTYRNLGDARLVGTDIGVRYVLTEQVGVDGTLSVAKLRDKEKVEAFGEATALNSPAVKWTLGLNLQGVSGFGGSAMVRRVEEYHFMSGINKGVIPAFATVDLNVGYRLPRLDNALLNVGVSNLFSCGQDDAQPLTYAAADANRTNPQNRAGKCKFGLKHQEMINMPQIGTMLFVGVRYHLQ